MHWSFVTTAPRSGGGQWIGKRAGFFYFTFTLSIVPTVRGWGGREFEGLYNKANTVKHTRLRGKLPCFTILLSPQCGGHSRELQTKRQSTLFHGAGVWLQMTGA